MSKKIAINGYGRIGRNILRAYYENKKRYADLSIVAINDLGDPAILQHLTQYDSTHGQFPYTVDLDTDKGELLIQEDRITVLSCRDPAQLPWKDLGVDIVLECTGFFTQRSTAALHLQGGAKKVLISAPAGADIDATIVYGVNNSVLKKEHTLVSNASCTTTALAPLVQVLDRALGVDNGLMTTIHAFTNDQVLNDVYHSDLRRARSATVSMIPTKTGAASALGLVLPGMGGRLDGFAMRVPTLNVSFVDLTVLLKKTCSVEEINCLFKEASEKTPLQGILAYNEKPLVSVDFNHNSASSIFDATQTKAQGSLVKICAWYDNEWGFSNRMLDTVEAMFSCGF
jgi:glyceraldehyde 3-phosphate dehydrogenase